jgi:serine protease Do
VELRLRRDNSEMAMKATLTDRNAGPQSERAEFQNALGGKLSDRRSGFPLALQHDTVLRPNLCGGPVVDLDGKTIGINIARAGRVASYALPGNVIIPLLNDLKSGKLAPEMKTMLVDTQDNETSKANPE